MAIFGPSLTTLSHKKMRLSEPATVVNSERLKPPYVGVTADLVIRPFLPFLSFHNCCACTYVPVKARILAMSPAKWLHPPTSTTELTSQLFLLARFICAYYKRASLRSAQVFILVSSWKIGESVDKTKDHYGTVKWMVGFSSAVLMLFAFEMSEEAHAVGILKKVSEQSERALTKTQAMNPAKLLHT